LNGKRVALGGQIEMRPGDELVLLVPGGGGIGDPKSRPAEAVAEDVKNGLVDLSEAERVYHVKLDKTFQGSR
jgi:N-methylhydantoinase B